MHIAENRTLSSTSAIKNNSIYYFIVESDIKYELTFLSTDICNNKNCLEFYDNFLRCYSY